MGEVPTFGATLDGLALFRRKPRIEGGNIYRAIGKPNEVNGQPAWRGVATVIDWEYLGINPVESITRNMALVKEHFRPDEEHTYQEPVAVVAYGHSLRETWPELRNFNTIFTCSGAHKFLLEQGIKPTYHVDSDPRPHKVIMLGQPDPDVTYLPCSIVHPAYIEKLRDEGCDKIALWHLLFYEPAIFHVLPDNEWLMTGGDTIGPRTAKMARLLGHVNLHFFGFDACADDAKQTHAADHLNPKADKLEKIDFLGRSYWIREDWMVHAHTLIYDLDRMPEVKATFYGDSLLPAMFKAHVPIYRSKIPMGVFKQ